MKAKSLCRSVESESPELSEQKDVILLQIPSDSTSLGWKDPAAAAEHGAGTRLKNDDDSLRWVGKYSA